MFCVGVICSEYTRVGCDERRVVVERWYGGRVMVVVVVVVV